MVNLDAIFTWLCFRITADFVSEAWIFGSVLDAVSRPNDIDIFVKYLDEHSKQIPPWRRKIQREFLERFALPLHVLALTNSECIEEAMFLEISLKRARRFR